MLRITAGFFLVLTLVYAQAGKSPAGMDTFQIPSHGSLLNALVYVAAGEGPHPAVVLLHGFPGNERNLDLAQDIRHAGWDGLVIHYRGSWGTPGDFSFSHGIEDTAAAVAYLRQPEYAKRLRLDPAKIVLIGHSMGGFMAVEGAAADASIRAVGLISAADLAGRVPESIPADRRGRRDRGDGERLCERRHGSARGLHAGRPCARDAGERCAVEIREESARARGPSIPDRDFG